MKKYFIVAGLSFSLLFSSVTATSAKEPVNRIHLSPTHTLLTYSFTETFVNRDIVAPMLAATTASHSPLTAGYQLTGIDASAIVSEVALVLSNATISHGGYAVKEKTKQTYMLIVLVEHTPNTRPAAITLTSLPVLLTTGGEVDGQTVKTY